MPSSQLAVEPAYQSCPAYTRTLGPEVADLCDHVGFTPDPEQRLALDMMFALGDDNKAAAFEFAVVVARQNLKTGLFKQATLGWLYITEQRLITWSAHEFSTAQEAFRDMKDLVTGSDWLRRRVKKVLEGNGEESIEMRNGARLKFKARTKTGGRGLTGDKMVLDEAFALQPHHMGALLPTLAVRPDPQVVYGSSAGLAISEILRNLRDRGRVGDPSLAYLEWSIPRGGCDDPECTHEPGVEGCALDKLELRRRANPLLGRVRANGTGLTNERLDAFRRSLPWTEFAREHMSWWDEAASTAAAFGPGNWEACAYPDGQQIPDGLAPAALAIAVSYDLTRAAIGAAAIDGDDVGHLVPLEHGLGTDWVAATAKALQDEYDVDVVIDGKGPGHDLIEALQAEGVELHIATTDDVLDAYAGIQKRVKGRTVRHADFTELNAAAAAAVPRNVGDRQAWGRKTSTADISVLEAETLALWWAGKIHDTPAPPPAVERNPAATVTHDLATAGF